MDREEKNKKISESKKATAAKRQQQVCKVYILKLRNNKMSKNTKNELRSLFLQAKWLRNFALDKDWKTFDTKIKKVSVKTPDGLRPDHSHWVVKSSRKSSNNLGMML